MCFTVLLSVLHLYNETPFNVWYIYCIYFLPGRARQILFVSSWDQPSQAS